MATSAASAATGPACWRWTTRWSAPRLDLSGRGFLVWNVRFPTERIGTFDTALVREFFTAFAVNGGVTLNLACLDGVNSHHIAEACFKAVARALREAVETDPRAGADVPSTKGTLGR